MISKDRFEQIALSTAENTFGFEFQFMVPQPFVKFAHALIKAIEQEAECLGTVGALFDECVIEQCGYPRATKLIALPLIGD